jgi:hypothetical protein
MFATSISAAIRIHILNATLTDDFRSIYTHEFYKTDDPNSSNW